MHRHSTPLTEEKLPVKESLTPFLGENEISAKDIPKLEEWPTFSGEGEYNHIEFIRKIDILQKKFHIPDQIVVAKVNLETGAFCTCIGKDYLQITLPEWKNHLLPIEGVKFSSSSNNMYPLGIIDTNLVFPHPAGSVRMKTEIVVMENCKSQHIILGNGHLNGYGADINNHKDRQFTIRENKRQNFAFSNMPKQIPIASSNKDTHKEKFVNNQLIEARINPSLSPKMRLELVHVLYIYNNEFGADN
ncbi:hypothetical protein O181_007602 [Austropuccinia psidii MF-1]|uniref:Uncharacterized protein n=1 Tax=Austropuccinia psidii MF-1 TaxID=1389203 RepID=A0A9Q3BM92_9BASI|nr:hypothetical protein [Austropuccinia psidii MF-1]